MTKPESMTNEKWRSVFFRHSGFVIRASSFVFLCWWTLTGLSAAADNLGVLGSKPKWDVLENYQGAITHDEFAHLINDVYCTHGVPDDLIRVDKDSAQIVTDKDSHAVFALKFAPDENSKARVPRLWRPAKALPPAKPNPPKGGF